MEVYEETFWQFMIFVIKNLDPDSSKKPGFGLKNYWSGFEKGSKTHLGTVPSKVPYGRYGTFTLMRIRVQLPNIMQIRIRNPSNFVLCCADKMSTLGETAKQKSNAFVQGSREIVHRFVHKPALFKSFYCGERHYSTGSS
jgi:hypothetical protein